MSQRPLILLLDDRPQPRESMRALFEANECSVIPVANYESALSELSSRPDINFVVTDINLTPETGNSGVVSLDKTGIVFARLVKQIRPEIAIAAYTAVGKKLNLSISDYRVFDLFLDKGNDDPEAVMKFIMECKSFAIIQIQLSKDLKGVRVPLEDATVRKIADLEDSIKELKKELSSRYVRWPTFSGTMSKANIALAVAGAIASIVGLYLFLRT